MEKLYLSLAALLLTGYNIVFAQSVTYNYTGGMQTFTVPSCVTSITIDARGAQGGNASGGDGTGGFGARTLGTFSVTPGQQLTILVGGQGAVNTSSGQGAGGGGGTFVVNSTNTPWIVAGGGGGGGGNGANNGSPGSATTSGTDGTNAASGGGGSNGGGGGGSSDNGGCVSSGGGGGFCGNGGENGNGGGSPGAGGNGCANGGTGGTSNICTTGYGMSFLNGGAGGVGCTFGGCSSTDGGYGGGAGTAGGGGGGGGGYSGGGGGGYNGSTGGGGGGGSYNIGTNQTNTGGYQVGNGEVIITWVSNPIATVTISGITNVSCNGDDDGSATANPSGGNAPYTYSWAPAGGSHATGTGLSAGNYTVTVTDNTGCIATASATITQPVPITGTATSTGEWCYGYNNATATITPSGGTAPYNYSWNPGGQVGATAIGLSTGTYTVTITDASGCAGSATVTITQPPQTVVGFFSDVNQGCVPFCTQFNNTTTGVGLFYVWSFGDGDTSHAQNPIHCYSKSGIYTVILTVYNDSGCSATLNQTNLINAYTPPIASFTYSPQPATIFDPTVQFTSRSTDQYGISQWLWTFGDETDSVSYQQNPIHTYQDTGTYCAKLKVTNMYGCADSVTNCLIVDPVFTIYIPSAFTPNGDGLNDVFMAKGEYIKGFEMYIFDRWGVELFHSNNINIGWNGKATGSSKICQEDTYVYRILVTDYANKQHVYVGNVTILK